MRGTVEIYRQFGTPEQELISQDSNFVVDGAGEVLADIMLVPALVSGVPTASSILDVSNYTVNAISFAPTPLGWITNSHDVANNNTIRDGAYASGAFAAFTTPEHVVVGYASGSTVSSVHTLNGLLSATAPIDSQLMQEFDAIYNEIEAASAYSISATDPKRLPKTDVLKLYQYNSLARELGHHPNFIQYFRTVPADKQIPVNSQGAKTPNDDSLNNIAIARGAGAWPAASGTNIAIFYAGNVLPTTPAAPPFDARGFIRLDPGFNEVSSMDFRGFVRAYQLSEEQDPASGLITSATTTFSSTGEVTYHLTIASGDLACCQFFGGIYKLGLWALDLSSTLANGVQAPFDWIDASGVTEREFKLIAKKQLLDNLADIRDDGLIAGVEQYEPLTLIWRLHFI